MQTACPAVPGIAVRSQQNPCGLPYRVVDGAHRLCAHKQALWEWHEAGGAGLPPCAPRYFVLEESDFAPLINKMNGRWVAFKKDDAPTLQRHMAQYLPVTGPLSRGSVYYDVLVGSGGEATHDHLFSPDGHYPKNELCFRYFGDAGPRVHCVDAIADERRGGSSKDLAIRWERALSDAFAVDLDSVGFGVTQPICRTMYPLPMVAQMPTTFAKTLRVLHTKHGLSRAECVLTLRTWPRGERFADPTRAPRIRVADMEAAVAAASSMPQAVEVSASGAQMEAADEDAATELGRLILASLRAYGFVTLKFNPGEAEDLDAAAAAAAEFFDGSKKSKKRCCIAGGASIADRSPCCPSA